MMFPERSIYCPQCKGYMGHFTTDHKDLRCRKCDSQFQMVSSVLGVSKDGEKYFNYEARGTIWINTDFNNVDKKPTDDKLEVE